MAPPRARERVNCKWLNELCSLNEPWKEKKEIKF